MNIWKELIEFVDIRFNYVFNSKFISRQDILCYIYGEIRKSDQCTVVDNYRRYLTKARYLEWISPGKYKIIKSPKNKSLMQVKNEAYPGTAIKEKLRRRGGQKGDRALDEYEKMQKECKKLKYLLLKLKNNVTSISNVTKNQKEFNVW